MRQRRSVDPSTPPLTWGCEFAVSGSRDARQRYSSSAPSPSRPSRPSNRGASAGGPTPRSSTSRSKLYELLRAKAIESVRIDRLRRIPTEALCEYIDRLREA